MGTIADKLTYLAATKDKLYRAMIGLGYEVNDSTTLRDAVDMLYDAAIEKYVEDFDVSDLPDYWRQEFKNALTYLLTVYDDYDVHHVLVTDQHYQYNYQKSETIIALLESTGLFGKLIHLGDLTHNQTTFETDWDMGVAFLEPYKGDLLYVAGNHDARTDALVTQFYEEFVEGDSDLQGYPEELNYYYDDDTHKIRYIVLNTVINGSTAYSRLATFFSSTPAGYTPIILSHYSVFPFHYTPNDPTALYSVDSRWHAACDDFLKWVLSSGKPCAAWIHGHHHRDGWGDWFDFGAVKSLTFGNDGHTDQAFTKTEGTVDENAVAIMSISSSRREIKAYKIGQQFAYGRQMTLNWNLSPTYATDFAQGFHMDTTEIEGGREATRYVYTKPLPVKKANGTPYQYYIHANGKLTHIYCDVWRSNFVKQTRLSKDADANGGYTLTSTNANARYFSLGIATSESVDPADIYVEVLNP